MTYGQVATTFSGHVANGKDSSSLCEHFGAVNSVVAALSDLESAVQYLTP